jgi:NAD(P)-dependent dehydrogenase (short-subunit alcohol dehydrogenase family)
VRIVVVTGASSGIGRAAARMFAARGDRVIMAARGKAQLESAARECGGQAYPVDVTDGTQVDALARAAVAEHGRIDVWVDTAAVMAYGRFEDVPADVFDRVIATDLLGSANVARAALRVFRRRSRGVLILCGSVVGRITAPYMSAYVTAKWGQRALARTLRQETRDVPDLHVCLLNPGGVDTPIYTSAANYAGRVGRPPPPVDTVERVARAIVRLADRPRAQVDVGLTNGLIGFGFTALPRVYDALVGPGMRLAGLSRQRVAPDEGNVFRSRTPTEGGPARWGRGGAVAAVVVAAAVTIGVARPGRSGGTRRRNRRVRPR